jgi:hypothetical protein
MIFDEYILEEYTQSITVQQHYTTPDYSSCFKDIIYTLCQIIKNDEIISNINKCYKIIYDCVLIELKYYFKYINEQKTANIWRQFIGCL